MILTDTGPLVALLNRNDPNHATCAGAAARLPSGPLKTTWPCLTEAMYLLHKAGGYVGQEALWRLLGTGRLTLHNLAEADWDHMALLMGKYRDLPMDLADASLIAAAERLNVRRIFTLDRDFFIYRFADGTAAEVFP